MSFAEPPPCRCASRDYALIGNTRSAALVGNDASIGESGQPYRRMRASIPLTSPTQYRVDVTHAAERQRP